jgi:penicillin amidase
MGLALRATGTQGGIPWADSIRGILHASSADELEEALRNWNEPVNNYVYADVRGEFGYRLRGRIPVRHESNRWRPVPGWEDTYEWRGDIPFDEMPHARNPDTGYVVTCNQRVAPADYPHYIGMDFAPEYRARRITDRLREIPPGTATVDSMAGVHAERTSIPGTILAGAVTGIEPDSSEVRKARDLLVAWDGRMDRDSVAATIYSATRSAWLRDVLENTLGPLVSDVLAGGGRGGPTHAMQIAARAVTAMANNDDSILPEGVTWPAILERALTSAFRELIDRLGPDMKEWEWGKVHHTRPTHPLSAVFPELDGLLDPSRVSASGDGDTPQQGGYALENRYIVAALSVNRYIHDPSDWTRSEWIVPLGASGHPGSHHYADQAEMWANVDYIPQLWDWDEIEERAETRQELVPDN